jgi:hypothetical protein
MVVQVAVQVVPQQVPRRQVEFHSFRKVAQAATGQETVKAAVVVAALALSAQTLPALLAAMAVLVCPILCKQDRRKLMQAAVLVMVRQ